MVSMNCKALYPGASLVYISVDSLAIFFMEFENVHFGDFVRNIIFPNISCTCFSRLTCNENIVASYKASFILDVSVCRQNIK